MALADFVIERRKTLQLSIRALARRVPCSPTHIMDIEKGRADNLTLETMVKLSAAIGVSVHRLVREAVKPE